MKSQPIINLNTSSSAETNIRAETLSLQKTSTKQEEEDELKTAMIECHMLVHLGSEEAIEAQSPSELENTCKTLSSMPMVTILDQITKQIQTIMQLKVQDVMQELNENDVDRVRKHPHIPSLPLDLVSVSVAMMTSSVKMTDSQHYNSNSERSDETWTKMRANIKKHLLYEQKIESHRIVNLDERYEKIICKLENDIREKLSTNLKMQLYNDYLEEKVQKQKSKFSKLKEESEAQIITATRECKEITEKYDLQRENAIKLVTGLQEQLGINKKQQENLDTLTQLYENQKKSNKIGSSSNIISISVATQTQGSQQNNRQNMQGPANLSLYPDTTGSYSLTRLNGQHQKAPENKKIPYTRQSVSIEHLNKRRKDGSAVKHNLLFQGGESVASTHTISMATSNLSSVKNDRRIIQVAKKYQDEAPLLNRTILDNGHTKSSNRISGFRDIQLNEESQERLETVNGDIWPSLNNDTGSQATLYEKQRINQNVRLKNIDGQTLAKKQAAFAQKKVLNAAQYSSVQQIPQRSQKKAAKKLMETGTIDIDVKKNRLQRTSSESPEIGMMQRTQFATNVFQRRQSQDNLVGRYGPQKQNGQETRKLVITDNKQQAQKVLVQSQQLKPKGYVAQQFKTWKEASVQKITVSMDRSRH